MKNILIISKNECEASTEDVMDWIGFLGHNSVRFNGDTLENFKSINLRIDNNNLTLDNDKKMLNSYDAMWIRRWSDFKSLNILTQKLESENYTFNVSRKIINCYAQDLNFLKILILKSFNSKKTLSNINQISVSKINVLKSAEKTGFTVPKFIVTTSKKHLLDFKKIVKEIVIKDLDAQLSILDKDKNIMSFVEKFNSSQIKKLPNYFAPSFFQELIYKKYEIRTFFLKDKIYSMAIFSQENKQTVTDFRKYSFHRPNRVVPYKLPISIESKIKKLMKKLNLETGSLDFIKNVNNQYVFLEVNPVGQFSMVSTPCNYKIEKIIAQYLIK